MQARHRSEQKDATSFDDFKAREHLLEPGAKAVWGVDLPVRVPKPLESTFFPRASAPHTLMTS